MFKTFAIAAAIALTSPVAQAAPTPAELFAHDTIAPAAASSFIAEQSIETAYYCQWVTVYECY